MSRGDRREDIVDDASLAHLGASTRANTNLYKWMRARANENSAGRSDWDMSLEQTYLWVDPCDDDDDSHWPHYDNDKDKRFPVRCNKPQPNRTRPLSPRQSQAIPGHPDRRTGHKFLGGTILPFCLVRFSICFFSASRSFLCHQKAAPE